ncbi:uncharacterized protein LOC128199873 [Bicyclus anynana]|uniref:Uncharacterized protein LOC128199873 n=1 Tax=Bicyclus anynana TaxID=110368 RepID=A0ABM3M6Q4_BICAN|nr:uncharacterized protein LOC128199873 [Bicyclus anynana]
MEHNTKETSNDKKLLNKAKSQYNEQSKASCNPVKHKSFNMNEAVRSLDIALGRLKKSKLVNGECIGNKISVCPGRSGADSMFIDSPQVNMSDVENTSVISMDFSHYELLRNVSEINCNSDDTLGNTTSKTFSSLSDITSKEEQLERYFRSAEIWNRNRKEAGSSGLRDN